MSVEGDLGLESTVERYGECSTLPFASASIYIQHIFCTHKKEPISISIIPKQIAVPWVVCTHKICILGYMSNLQI